MRDSARGLRLASGRLVRVGICDARPDVLRPTTFAWHRCGLLVLICAAFACAGTNRPKTSSTPPARVHFELARVLMAPATVVFAHLHEPAELRWLGRFRLVRRGLDPREPAGLGSTRRVSFVVPLVEETITGFAPPCALDYAVTFSRAYADHRAAMRLTSRANGATQLRWSVGFTSLKRNPRRHARFTRWYLQRALVRLDRRLHREAHRRPWPTAVSGGRQCYGDAHDR